jgi:hypothetical protein
MREGCLATAYFPEEDSISSFRFGCKPVIKPVSNLKLRIIIQVFGLSAPQRIYTSSAESLSLLRAVLRRNTRGLCSQGRQKSAWHRYRLSVNHYTFVHKKPQLVVLVIFIQLLRKTFSLHIQCNIFTYCTV